MEPIAQSLLDQLIEHFPVKDCGVHISESRRILQAQWGIMLAIDAHLTVERWPGGHKIHEDIKTFDELFPYGKQANMRHIPSLEEADTVLNGYVTPAEMDGEGNVIKEEHRHTGFLAGTKILFNAYNEAVAGEPTPEKEAEAIKILIETQTSFARAFDLYNVTAFACQRASGAGGVFHQLTWE